MHLYKYAKFLSSSMQRFLSYQKLFPALQYMHRIALRRSEQIVSTRCRLQHNGSHETQHGHLANKQKVGT